MWKREADALFFVGKVVCCADQVIGREYFAEQGGFRVVGSKDGGVTVEMFFQAGEVFDGVGGDGPAGKCCGDVVQSGEDVPEDEVLFFGGEQVDGGFSEEYFCEVGDGGYVVGEDRGPGPDDFFPDGFCKPGCGEEHPGPERVLFCLLYVGLDQVVDFVAGEGRDDFWLHEEGFLCVSIGCGNYLRCG